MEFAIEKGMPFDLDGDYSELLLSQMTTLFYQSLSYHKLLEKHLAAEAYYFLWFQEKQLKAVFPFMIKRNDEYGAVLNSLPYYGSNGGPVYSNELSGEDIKWINTSLLKEFDSFCHKEGIVLSTIVTNPYCPEETDWFTQNWKHDKTDYRIGQITPIPNTETVETDLMELFSNPRPRNIRRAIKAEISVTVEHDKVSLDFLYNVHKENIESIGGIPKRKEFFELIPEYFSDEEFAVFVARKDNEPIAAILLFYFNKTVEYFTPATIHDFRRDQPSALLIFEAMKEASKKGFENWNWGGTWKSQEGVYDFKKRWGAQDHEYKYFIRFNDPDIIDQPIEGLKKAFPNFYLYPY
ncbi:peptidoglycan bridge formation glycyltransferase FemA/FemB family protein [Roseivirga misakiensis]|uniref:N-acetyltransferase domain-containing protein n=1 Tax=Roseivirga misakiensis TaxID=1563681 RepID=A0A1E5T1G6_9BACT|nr:peptidoglycan bridge formation glycyltransferase FemA/FemB family protein [Roseivirga misakiensis]OEK05223.1 hypothetical protein BFP71_17625 [Roseivirga misakiensis]